MRLPPANGAGVGAGKAPTGPPGRGARPARDSPPAKRAGANEGAEPRWAAAERKGGGREWMEASAMERSSRWRGRKPRQSSTVMVPATRAHRTGRALTKNAVRPKAKIGDSVAVRRATPSAEERPDGGRATVNEDDGGCRLRTAEAPTIKYMATRVKARLAGSEMTLAGVSSLASSTEAARVTSCRC